MENVKKTFVTPAEAIEAINGGAIIRCETKSGCSEIQKTKKKYAFTVTANENPPLTYYGDLRSLKKIVNSPYSREALYLVEAE